MIVGNYRFYGPHKSVSIEMAARWVSYLLKWQYLPIMSLSCS